MLEIRTNEADNSAKIIVIGVGGAGNNAVNRNYSFHFIYVAAHFHDSFFNQP